jgi:hypothetical protein
MAAVEKRGGNQPSKFSLLMGPQDAPYKETPRRMVSVDGKHKSLWIGEDTILATVSTQETDAALWDLAREKVERRDRGRL